MNPDLSLAPVSRASITSETNLRRLNRCISLIATIPSAVVGDDAVSLPMTDKPYWRMAKDAGETTLWRTTFSNNPWFARVTKLEIPYETVHQFLYLQKCATERECLFKPQDAVDILEEGMMEHVKVQREQEPTYIVITWCILSRT